MGKQYISASLKPCSIHLKGVSSAVCMHQMFLEEGTRPSNKAQRHVNPIMMDVVQKEIIKLVDVDMLYPILDGIWVSQVHVVPMK